MESRKNAAGRKIYRCKARIEMPAKLLIEAITNTDKVCEWNATLTEARVLKTVNKNCVISYQVRQLDVICLLYINIFHYNYMKMYIMYNIPDLPLPGDQ